MIRLCALLSVGLLGCGISASTRSAIREPGKLSAVLPAEAQLVVKAGAGEVIGAGSAAGESAASAGPNGLLFSPIAFGIGAALESQREIARVDATTKLGIADPAQGLSKEIWSGLQKLGYPQPALVNGVRVRLTNADSEMPKFVLEKTDTPYVLYVQVDQVHGDEGGPTGLDATLSLYHHDGLLAFRRSCSVSPNDEDSKQAVYDQWAALEHRCATRLLEGF
ncbi:MAG: hypothetical protein QM723_28350 [Myxococcaceae bacterium]